MTALERPDLDTSAGFAVRIDVVLFTITDDRLMVTLIDQGNPTKEPLSLPGGLLRPSENLMDAAIRGLHDATGLEIESLTQLGAYGLRDRHITAEVTIGYWAIVADSSVPAGTPGADARRTPVDEVLEGNVELREGDRLLIGDALEEARLALENTTLATEFCGDQFTITDLRNVYEIIWGVPLDQGNFQNKVLEIEDFVVPTGERRAGGRGRPPELFTAGDALIIDPPFRRPRTESEPKLPKWEETPKPSMGFKGYVDRVGFHFDRLGVTERPTQQQYIDAWNNQIPAGKMAASFARRLKRKADHESGE